MYARSTTFEGMPANVDAGIAFVRTEAAPMLAKAPGCRGLSLLVDRAHRAVHRHQLLGHGGGDARR